MIFSRFKWDAQTILELTKPSCVYLYFKTHRLNLLTGFPESFGIEKLRTDLENIKLQDKVKKTKVYHFYYEYSFYDLDLAYLISNDTPLALEIEYVSSKKKSPPKSKLSSLPLKHLERPSWSEYKIAFNKIQQELLSGNCYQVNLTFPYDFQTDDFLDPRDLMDYFFSQKGLGAFAHATYFGEGMILSNSPECLFQYRDKQIFTMPIKGTMKCSPKEFTEKWQLLLKDHKEKGELLMITDLLKNDLNYLSGYKAVVNKLRAPLMVPGLIHQYSLISAPLSEAVSLKNVMRALFPGGSITGAPKRRVMQIISEIERFQRGIYCGSTLLCYGDRKVASINIRTAFIWPEERVWRYGAGGGVTLLSKPLDEFKEMESKVQSFLTMLKVQGY